MKRIVASLLVILSGFASATNDKKPPHIVLLLADDLGWNDVSFHNSRVVSPNIDKMATEGMKLTQSYALPVCSPSRQALLSGRYPFRDGAQHMIYTDVHPKCMPLDLKLLPEKLQELGYANHLVGKWHLGYCHEACTPSKRGFKSFYGFLGGAIDHTEFSRDGASDFRDNENIVKETEGKFSTKLFTDRAVNIITAHNTEEPMFLYMSYDMTHLPLQVPETYTNQYLDIDDEARRTYLGMVTFMDESIGNITKALEERGMVDNAIIIFQSDNGGQPTFGGNNYPLRGGKLSLWEGGTRVPAVVSGGYLNTTQHTSDSLFHISDWYPTLVEAAGGKIEPCEDGHIDGVSQLEILQTGRSGPRHDIVYNLDIHSDVGPPIAGYAAYRYGDYKLILGYPGSCDIGWPSPWLRPAEHCQTEADMENPECQFKDVVMTQGQGHQRQQNILKQGMKKMFDMSEQLYNLKSDPFEREDISEEHPELLSLLKSRLEQYMEQVAAPVMPRPIIKMADRIQDGYHGPGWCQLQDLYDSRTKSLHGAKRKVTDTCSAKEE